MAITASPATRKFFGLQSPCTRLTRRAAESRISRSNCGARSGWRQRRGAVVGIEAELVEDRLVAETRLASRRRASRDAHDGRQHLADAAGDFRSDLAAQQLRLPGLGLRGRGGHGERQVVAILEQDLGHAARRADRGPAQRSPSDSRKMRLRVGEPVLLHAQFGERLLQHQACSRRFHQQHGVGDAAAQFADRLGSGMPRAARYSEALAAVSWSKRSEYQAWAFGRGVNVRRAGPGMVE